ncbi:hypothetical protein NDU88_003405 [Pleurodeles waltl]|uniref:Uncharacterized protein n=1 Tax=Pleurodeles waltl TaxID=8319 RepID=A0AAV7T4W1_PLEWA|nr:hypothetical protein NDU88_003405 [Pleurodeles waltl]
MTHRPAPMRHAEPRLLGTPGYRPLDKCIIYDFSGASTSIEQTEVASLGRHLVVLQHYWATKSKIGVA